MEIYDIIQYQSDTSLFYIDLWDLMALMSDGEDSSPESGSRVLRDPGYGKFPPMKIYQNTSVTSLDKCD